MTICIVLCTQNQITGGDCCHSVLTGMAMAANGVENDLNVADPHYAICSSVFNRCAKFPN